MESETSPNPSHAKEASHSWEASGFAMSTSGYCIETPPCVAFSFFSSFSFRAPMAFWIQEST